MRGTTGARFFPGFMEGRWQNASTRNTAPAGAEDEGSWATAYGP